MPFNSRLGVFDDEQFNDFSKDYVTVGFSALKKPLSLISLSTNKLVLNTTAIGAGLGQFNRPPLR